MKNKLLSDIKTSLELFKNMRQIRKNGGSSIEVVQKVQIPLVKLGPGLYDTVEGSVLSQCEKAVIDAALEAFGQLPYEEKHRLCFAPRDGEYLQRAKYWKRLLEPELTPKQCRTATMHILHWFIHVKKEDVV